MAQLLAAPYSYFADQNGEPLAGGKVYTYAAGTTTPQASYTEVTGTVAASNPVILDSAGRAAIWLQGSYKLVVKDANNVVQWTVDNVSTQATTAPYAVQVHPNAGGSNTGHNLMWADQNTDQQADHDALYSYDASLIFNFLIGGTITAGDVVGFDFTVAGTVYQIRYTVITLDNVNNIAAQIAYLIANNTPLNNALLAFNTGDKYGYVTRAYSSGASVIFNFPWAASGNNVAPYLSGGATETNVIANAAMAFPYGQLDNGPYKGVARYVPGRPLQSGDLLGVYFFNGQSGPNTNIDSTFGWIRSRVVGVSPLLITTSIGGAVQSGSNPLNGTDVLHFCKGAYGSLSDGSGNPCVGGDTGYGRMNMDAGYDVQGHSIDTIYPINTFNAAFSNAAGTTIPASTLKTGGMFRVGAAGAVTDTTCTAALLVAAINQAKASRQWVFHLVNGNGGTLSISPGVGVTLTGNLVGGTFQIASGSSKLLTINVTNATAGSETVNILG